MRIEKPSTNGAFVMSLLPSWTRTCIKILFTLTRSATWTVRAPPRKIIAIPQAKKKKARRSAIERACL